MIPPLPTSHSDTPPLRPGFHAGRFRNPGRHDDRTLFDVLRWKTGGRAAPWPRFVPLTPRAAPLAPGRGLAVTWIGHASFLIQTPNLCIVVDPVWSERIGLFGRIGPRRAIPPAISFTTLPPIDAVLLSHDHYDHCDLPTLRRLAREHPRAQLLAPLGFEDIAQRAGFAFARFTAQDWWQTSAADARATYTATPARHWGNRISSGRNRRLWCGWHIATPHGTVFFAGDTAYDENMFPAVRLRLGAPDVALLPIGAYAPRWFMREQHCEPEEAVLIHRALGAVRSLGGHWGTFRLTDEAREEPPTRLGAAVRAAGLAPDDFMAAEPGETLHLLPAKGE